MFFSKNKNTVVHKSLQQLSLYSPRVCEDYSWNTEQAIVYYRMNEYTAAQNPRTSEKTKADALKGS